MLNQVIGTALESGYQHSETFQRYLPCFVISRYVVPGDRTQGCSISEHGHQGLWERVFWEEVPSLGQDLCWERNADAISGEA